MVRWLIGPLVVYWLAIVLAASTPLGGVVDWAHQGQMLEPLWPHVHLANGRTIPASQAALPGDATAGPALTAGSGAGPESLALGVALAPPPAAGQLDIA